MAPHDDVPEQLDPQQDRVRRLLADARHDEPVPDDVAARLDRVLGRLVVEEPVVADAVSAPADLTSHRRRRARTALLAAAAAVAIGVGVGQLDLTVGGSESDSAADGGGSAETAGQAARDLAAEPESAAQAGSVDRLRRPAPTPTSVEPVEVTAQGFARDARRRARASGLLGAAAVSDRTEDPSAFDAGGAGAAHGTGGDTVSAAPSEELLRRADWFTCDPGPYGEGRLAAVEYDARSAVLAFRPPTEQSLVVELLQCGTGRVLRSMTIPLP